MMILLGLGGDRLVAGFLLLLLLAILGGAERLTAQQSADLWGTTTVTANMNTAMWAAVGDIDGDGDEDTLVGGFAGDIVWFENLQGGGAEWVDHEIDVGTMAFTVAVADVDGDGDLDVLAGTVGFEPLTWFENVAGDGLLWSRHVILDGPYTIRSIVVTDIDGDGDPDLLFAAEFAGIVGWSENTAGDGSSWTEHSADNLNKPLSVFSGDIDGDGDLDALAACYGSGRVLWIENLYGDGSAWVGNSINIQAVGAHGVSAGDVDRDGDLDVFEASFGIDVMAWHDNLDGDGSSWEAHNLPVLGGRFIMVVADDLDGDGDLDAASVSFDLGDLTGWPEPSLVAWYENVSGDGAFWEVETVSSDLGKGRSLAIGDVDGDCSLELLAAVSTNNSVFWYDQQDPFADCGLAWTDLGGGSGGQLGVPVLEGFGSLAEGSTATLSLTNVLDNAAALLLVAPVSQPVNVLGGTLFAIPSSVALPVYANPQGTLQLSGVWPGGVPPGTEAWFQFVVQDGSTVAGKTLSNALKAVTP